MPLSKGPGKNKFQNNLKTEMHAGKPLAQSLAISYALAKRSKKYAEGGMTEADRIVNDPSKTAALMDVASSQAAMKDKLQHGATGDKARDEERPVTRRPGDAFVKKAYAEGGEVMKDKRTRAMEAFKGTKADAGHQHGPECAEGCMLAEGGEAGTTGYQNDAEAARQRLGVTTATPAKPADERDSTPTTEPATSFKQVIRSVQKKPLAMAEGGDVPDDEYEDAYGDEDGEGLDMIDRIMSRRAYSKGGQVANETTEDSGFAPNQFDNLVLRDELESSYTGANSGDEKGNAQEDEDRDDSTMRIMLKRRKQRNPNPA
jgi:hypothetical protein